MTRLHDPKHPHYRKARWAAGVFIVILGAVLGFVAAVTWTIPQYFFAEKLGRINPWMYWSDAYKDLLQDMLVADMRLTSLPFTVFAGAMLAFTALIIFKRHKFSHKGHIFLYIAGNVSAVVICVFILVPIHPLLTYSQVNAFKRPDIGEIQSRISDDLKQCPVLVAYLGGISDVNIVDSTAGYATYKRAAVSDISYQAQLLTDGGEAHKLVFNVRCVTDKKQDVECVSKERMYLYDSEASILNAAIYCPTRDAIYSVGFDQLMPYFDRDQNAIYRTKVAVSQSYTPVQLSKLRKDFRFGRHVTLQKISY